MNKSIHNVIEPEMIEIKKISSKNPSIKKTDIYKQSNSISNIFKNSLDIIKQKVSVINIRPTTLHIILKYVMEEIETTPIKGSEQKEFALKLIGELIIDLSDKEDEETLLKLLNDGTISNIIDLIVDATNGRLNINTTIVTTTRCINTCIPYFCSTKKKPTHPTN